MVDSQQPADADRGRHAAPWGYRVDDAQVVDLIRRAERHELGRRFLQQGAQDAVAATFGVHAFLVDAARDRLAAGPSAD